MHQGKFRVLQVSDIHLFADRNKALLGVPTQQSFQAVIDLFQPELPDTQFVLLTGDLSQDGSKPTYQRIAEMLKPCPVPIYCIPGNHDNPEVMASVFPLDNISMQKQIIVNNWQFILLNSHKSGAVEGYLDKTELTFLEKCLQEYPKHHSVIVFHHQPLLIECGWLAKLGLTNADELWKIVLNYPMIKSILFGHVHQVVEQTHQQIPCYSVPSTCIQFKGHQSHFELDNEPPGYRWLDFYPDGRMETGVKRVDKYVGVFDENAKGY